MCGAVLLDARCEVRGAARCCTVLYGALRMSSGRGTNGGVQEGGDWRVKARQSRVQCRAEQSSAEQRKAR